MFPEELTRQEIDRQLSDCGWLLQDRRYINITAGQWHVPVRAITNLEKSLSDNKPRSLLPMATGSGKTITAVLFGYRPIKYGPAKRIPFLVDCNNMGKQEHVCWP